MKKYNNRDYIAKNPRTRLNNKYNTTSQQYQQSQHPYQVPIQPPPAQYPPQSQIQPQATKESMFSNIAGSVVQGIALGTGSQLASRGIDAIMGTRKIEIIDKSITDTCIPEKDTYLKCINANENDNSQCKYLFELLNKCKNIHL
jgi:hypothetical protein